MPLLIDTYNVLHIVGILPPDLAGIEIDGLVKLIQTSRFSREKVQLICDGSPKFPALPAFYGRVSVRHAGPGRSADDLIAAIVNRISNPGTVIVVSSDQQVQRAGRRRRCRTISSEEFLQLLVEDHESQARRPRADPSPRSAQPLAGDAVNAWINIFGFSPEEMVQAESDRPAPAPQPPALPREENKPAAAEEIHPSAKDTAKDADPSIPSPILPADIIDQAEQLWKAQQDD